nr:zinc finger, CCHC-type [Tanacetum cinerariifolium]
MEKEDALLSFQHECGVCAEYPMPEDGGENPTVEQVRRRAKWDNDDYVCRGLILNGSCIIDKLSPSWKDFKHTLKHLKEELTLIELSSHLRIEESLKVQDSDKPNGNNIAGHLVVNMVEYNNSSRYNDIKGGNVGNKANGSGTKGSGDGSSNHLKDQNMFNKSLQIYYVTYVSEVYFVQDDDVAWWVDSGATVHVCKDRCWFKTYESLNDGSILHMENESTALVHERGCVDIRYYVIEPNDSVSINSIIESRDAIFNQHRFSSVPRPSQRSLKDGTEDSGGSVVSERVTEEGFKQKSGIDYFNTYAPVARINIIRLLIAMASIHNLIIHQMDVNTTFLNEELKEEVYMNQPLGFIMPSNENKVCKLIKSLYGLKQAPKQWHQKFDEVVLSNGYLLNQADKCIYSKIDESGKGVIVCLYVDDMLIFGTDQVRVDLTKEFLSSRFSMKDMGEADVILGIRIKHESNDIAISLSYCIEKVLKKFNYSDCTLVSTPLDTCEKLMPNKGLVVSQLEYFRVIGYLMYAMTCKRPDIAFAVGKLSRYTSNPGTQHWQAIQRVLKYLKKTMDYRLASKKQTCIGSTMESEFVALAAASKEAEWLKNLLLEIPLWVKPMVPISIRCDSVSTLAKAYSQMYNGKSIHLGVKHSMIRELITNRVASIEFNNSINTNGIIVLGFLAILVFMLCVVVGDCATSEINKESMDPNVVKEGGSILGVLEDVIRVGQAIGTKKEWIKELSLKNNINFMAIQETKTNCISHMDVKFMWGNSKYNYVYSEAVGNSGGILRVWETNVFKKDYATILDNFVAIYGTWLPSNSKILFVAIYAPPQASYKRVLWEYVSTLIGRWNGETIILGDFNEVRSIDERRGSCFNPSSARVFGHFISSSGLVDVKLEGLEGFDAMVEQTWCAFSHYNVNRMIRFKKKLQDLKAIIRCWVKDKRMHRSGEKNSIKNELSDIDKEVDRGVVSDTNLFRHLELQRKLHDINQMEAKDSFQKSKIKWA